jgi:hypothetical protein
MSSQLRRSPRKHKKPGTKKAAKQTEPALPMIKWGADDGALTWALIAQLEVKENCLVLFGKDRKDEVRVNQSSFDPRLTEYMEPKLYPNLYAQQQYSAKTRPKHFK